MVLCCHWWWYQWCRVATFSSVNFSKFINFRKSYSINDIIEIHQQEIDPEPKTTILNEIKVIIKYSLPLIVTFLLQYSLTVASVFSVGRLGSTELAAVSLSSMTANISGYAMIQGVSTCLDTLCAQAFGRKIIIPLSSFHKVQLFIIITLYPHGDILGFRS